MSISNRKQYDDILSEFSVKAETGCAEPPLLVGFNNVGKPEASGERIVELPISELYPPEFHPFQVNADDDLQRLVRSVERYGVREPGIARPREGGGYELLAGNRRRLACETAGIATMPVIIRGLDDDTAATTMVDSNLEQREKLLLSEKAWAYRVKRCSTTPKTLDRCAGIFSSGAYFQVLECFVHSGFWKWAHGGKITSRWQGF